MTNPNDPAFLTDVIFEEHLQDSIGSKKHCGLTKREWLAGMATQGFCANKNGWGLSNDRIARYAISQADALIAELNKNEH